MTRLPSSKRFAADARRKAVAMAWKAVNVDGQTLHQGRGADYERLIWHTEILAYWKTLDKVNPYGIDLRNIKAMEAIEMMCIKVRNQKSDE